MTASQTQREAQLRLTALQQITLLSQALGAPDAIYLEDDRYVVFVPSPEAGRRWATGCDVGRPVRTPSTVEGFDKATFPAEFPRLFEIRTLIPSLPKVSHLLAVSA